MSTSPHDPQPAADDAKAARLLVHVVPARILLLVWSGLLVLTFVTVAATRIDLGAGNLWLAMAIATVKAGMVALYFMHLRYDRPFLGVVFLGALAFVLLFVGLALMDTQSYHPDLIPEYAPGIRQ